MNHYYRLVRSADGTRYMPAPETAKSQGKASKAVASVSVLLGLVAAGGNAWAQAPPANALPTGGQVAAGQASIGQNGKQMTINQGSDRAVINWQGFDIGSQAAVRFNQPGTSSVALNRVVAGDASQIHGQLSANGQLWVLNPNGVVFGAGSRVDVGGLVASTMHSSDADFMAGKAVFHRNGSTGSVLNQGEITAHGDGGQGGLVALLAPTVKNEGIIRAQLGSVVLAAGDRITLSTGVGGRLQVAPDPATVNTLIENKQLIVADGGQVLMTSRAADALSAGVVSNSGTVQARTLAHQEGRIVLLADMQHGSTQVAGLLDASAPDGGNGGFVDTSAAQVQIQAGTRVTTQAASGKTGQWLIDPTDFTISAGAATQTDSGIGADTLVANLASTDVTLQTVAAGSDKGSIHVNADVRYDANQLTLNAHHDININATMDVGGTGSLALNYGNTLGNAATAPAADSQLSINGRVNFAQAGAGLLSINGHGYTVINDVAALQGMDSNLSGKYALGADIDASATAGWNLNAGIYNGFVPIGSGSDNTDATRFTGSFDGLGHSIRNLTVNVTQPLGSYGYRSYAGLFGTTGSAARIAHVGLDNASIKASGSDNYAGALVGWNNGAILQSYATGSATAEGEYSLNFAGALVGYNTDSGSISQSYATGSATAEGENSLNFAGALVGGNRGGNISQSYATGSATAEGGGYNKNSAGALVGENLDGSIRQSYATGNATASGGSYDNSAGALVGANVYGNISQSYATGSATAEGGYQNSAGALVGMNNGSISQSYWNKDLATSAVGVGSAAGATGLTTEQMFDASHLAGFAWGTVWGNADNQSTPYLLGMAGNQVFIKTDVPSSVSHASRPPLYTAIQDVQQLQAMQNDLAGRYALVNHIDASATAGWNDVSAAWNLNAGIYNGFVPIGSNSDNTDATRFTGSFDGLGHSIRDLTVNARYPNFGYDSTSYAGLFGTTGSAARIAHVGLENARIKASGSWSYAGYAGALVGWNNGAILQSYATGSATAEWGVNNYAGALVGWNQGAILQSYATGSATAEGGINNYAGALVGVNDGGNISQSYATGSATALGGIGDYSGALVGMNGYDSISQSYWNKDLATSAVGGGSAAGATGLTTEQMFDASHFAGFAWGTVWGNAGNQSTPYLLGMAGNQVFIKTDVPSSVSHASRPQLYTAIQDVQQLQAMQNDLAGRYALVNHIDASATAGWNWDAGIYNGFVPIGSNSDNTDATRFTGSFDGLGHSIRDLTVNVTQPQGSIDGTSYAGLFGYTGSAARIAHVGLENASIKASGGNTNSVGALVGWNNGAIVQSHATGSATAEGQSDSTNFVGALVGANMDGSISQSYATGSATAEGGLGNSAGALVGWNQGAILQSYATGNATAEGYDNYAGALVGYNTGSGSISQSYATGSATAEGGLGNSAGALVGVNINGNISQSYATGSATAKDGNSNYAGALAGENYGSISQSYATGSATASGGSTATPRVRWWGKTTAASTKAMPRAALRPKMATPTTRARWWGRTTAASAKAMPQAAPRHRGGSTTTPRVRWWGKTTAASAKATGARTAIPGSQGWEITAV
ncbi:GLUG motif-containing protein [Comamonas testosteroni]|uniref:two-partner secretion domain-containing protein n=1 Tax=Comamonas testosteroni TaxID=285 RepID=UPI002E13BC87|nr:filamentous hemagglutinin N-terminal domain-containing protein [Comamonas testosteroni]